MTQNVEHTNRLVKELKEQYEQQITVLRSKISEYQEEIYRLNRQIDLITYKQSLND